ncbi:MAG: hypothetical protein WC444_03010 [Candidatus Paceibacterota bacterium]
MKRLGLYAVISLMFVGVLGGFVMPERAFAQATDSQTATGNALNSQGTYDYFFGIVKSDHDAFIKALDDKLLTVDANSPTYTIQRQATLDFKSAELLSFSAYSSVFEAEKQKATPAVDAQIKAIQAWQSSVDGAASKNLINKYSASAPQRGAYDQYTKEIQTGALLTALQIKSGNTTAGSDLANVQNNPSTITAAAAGNTNTPAVVRDTRPSDCSLASGNLVACIDSLIGWIIKNTLLQIAGFLVWFGANVLNYGVQLGILNFSKWATSDLYPIWAIVRQIVSLFIVFAGLYLGFMYIIGREKTFEAFFPWLIIFALFVNFSYPLTRTLIDVSNIVALNIYSSAVGPDALSGSLADLFSAGKSTPGALIMNKLGLQDLVMSATKVAGDSSSKGLVGGINTTAGALMAVVFVLYAAYIFFMAAGIIIVRTALLIFLTVASPILFVDSVIPALGEKAKTLRKLFFEQLVVAPVFMIMLALSLKFMDVFNKPGLLQQSAGSLSGLSGTGEGTIVTFFNLAMMLIMLNITMKVTKKIAGEAGTFATDAMGKVGGFGLGVATGGAGFLARGTAGKIAASARDSGWMDKMQGSRTGRGLYSLTNSLATSTYDARNIGAVNKGLTKAGMGAGIMGMGGMSKGSDATYDKTFAEKDKAMRSKYASIKDGDAREKYLTQKSSGGQLQGANIGGIRTDGQITAAKIKEEEGDQVKKYNSMKDGDRKDAFFESLPKSLRDQITSQANTVSPGVSAFGTMATNLQGQPSAATQAVMTAQAVNAQNQTTNPTTPGTPFVAPTGNVPAGTPRTPWQPNQQPAIFRQNTPRVRGAVGNNSFVAPVRGVTPPPNNAQRTNPNGITNPPSVMSASDVVNMQKTFNSSSFNPQIESFSERTAKRREEKQKSAINLIDTQTHEQQQASEQFAAETIARAQKGDDAAEEGSITTPPTSPSPKSGGADNFVPFEDLAVETIKKAQGGSSSSGETITRPPTVTPSPAGAAATV